MSSLTPFFFCYIHNDDSIIGIGQDSNEYTEGVN